MEETSAHSGGTALRAVKRFAQGRKTMMPGQITCPAQKKSRGPHRHLPVGGCSMAIITAALA